MADTTAGKSQPHEPGTPAETQPFEAAWRARFAEFAGESDDDAGIAGWSRSGLEARVRRFAALWVPPPEGARWLDAGCGAGTYARMLGRHGLEVVGADYSFPTLLKAKVRSTGPIAYATADVRNLPFRSASFDGVLCFGVMQALTRSDDAVKSLVAAVRPGGQVWIDALNRWCVASVITIARRRLKGEAMHLRYESPAAMKRLMRSQGLRRVRLHWLPIMPARLQRLQPWVEGKVADWIFRFVPLIGALVSHSFIVSGERRFAAPGR
jgi:ubiquinone/menaquinone biosynthesis C-methylase UbiE